jgi:hypothetical protein
MSVQRKPTDPVQRVDEIEPVEQLGPDALAKAGTGDGAVTVPGHDRPLATRLVEGLSRGPLHIVIIGIALI